jgi:hypothetical protein
LNTFLKTLVLLIAVGGFTPAVVACDSCALYIAEGAEHTGFTLSIAEQFTRLGTVWSGARQLGNPVDQYLDSSVTQVSVDYSRGDPWHVQLTLPYISRTYLRPEHADREHGRVSGLGDATLAMRYRLWQSTSPRAGEFAVNVLGGVEFATGAADHLGDEIGEDDAPQPGEFPESGVHGHDLALGSGSTDYLLGLDTGWTRGRLFARGQLQYKLRRPGAFDYRLADETSWELGAGGYVILTHQHSLAVEALFAADHKGLDTLAGEAQGDTGISIRYLGARVIGTLGQRLTADAAVELPVRIRTTATMVVPDYRLHAAVNWRF